MKIPTFTFKFKNEASWMMVFSVGPLTVGLLLISFVWLLRLLMG